MWKQIDISQYPYCHGEVGGLEYILRSPLRHEDVGLAPLPLFLHGYGERKGASDFGIKLVLRHGPWKAKAAEDFCILAPQCPKTEVWPTMCESVMTLLSHVQKVFPVDPTRIYVTGISMGAFGVWSLASHRPEMFAALAPICGGFASSHLPKGTGISSLKKLAIGLPEDSARRLALMHCKAIPVWLFHGSSDSVIDPMGSRDAYTILEAHNKNNVHLTEFPGINHSCWGLVYSNNALYSFFLKHRRVFDERNGAHSSAVKRRRLCVKFE